MTGSSKKKNKIKLKTKQKKDKKYQQKTKIATPTEEVKELLFKEKQGMREGSITPDVSCAFFTRKKKLTREENAFEGNLFKLG